MTSLSDLARKAGFDTPTSNGDRIYVLQASRHSGIDITEKIERLLALHVQELCAGVEPVAWLHMQGDHAEVSLRELDEYEIQRGWKQWPLYPASTVAALKARVAELETALQRLVDNLAEGEFISLTRIDEAREALRSKK